MQQQLDDAPPTSAWAQLILPLAMAIMLAARNWREMTSAQLAALATTIQAIAVLAALFFAWTQVRDARAVRRDQTRPYVSIHMERSVVSPILVSIVIQNIGQTEAR